MSDNKNGGVRTGGSGNYGAFLQHLNAGKHRQRAECVLPQCTRRPINGSIFLFFLTFFF